MNKPKGLALHNANKLIKFLQDEQPTTKEELQKQLARFSLQEGLRRETVYKYYTYIKDNKLYKYNIEL